MTTVQHSTSTIEQVLHELGTSQSGLSPEEASQRLARQGPNDISAKRVTGWTILYRQFRSSFIYLLLIAAALSFFLHEILNGTLIVLFILINSSLGFFQEFRSEHALRLLKAYIVHSANVRRSGQTQVIDRKLLVPGDVVLVETGDIIPADLRFFKEHNLEVDESILTGESAPVHKVAVALPTAPKETLQAKNLGFSGTMVVSGWGEGVVVVTGRDMQIGDIARLTVETVRESSFEKNLTRFSSFILYLVLFTLLFVIVTNIFMKGSRVNITTLVIFGIALAVSVIPEALPVVTTFSLSRGALRLAKNKVVVKRLSAIEDLGSIEVLCTDKTGTLTENSLKVAGVYPANTLEVFLYGCLASDTGEVTMRQPNNAFDLAIQAKLSEEQRSLLSTYERVDGLPFDPDRRRNSVVVDRKGVRELIVRGAPESILADCGDLSRQEKQAIHGWSQEEGRLGRRVILLAHKALPKKQRYALAEEEQDLKLVGLVSFVDPIKPTTKHAIERAKKLGVRVKILTGDSPEVAGAVAHEIGLVDSPDRVMTGAALEELSLHQRREALNQYAVFARVSPRQKYSIIQHLQLTNEVGFLGEGINDAPALKISNVALVVKGAADIAQEAADIILLKKSLGVIIDGIKEGRGIFANTTKYIKTTLASNFGNFYAVAVASLLVDFLPMLPLQILLVNLLSDFPMIAIATDTVDHAELARPKSYEMKEIVLVATFLGIVSTIFDFVFFGLFYRISPQVLQTNWFIASILTELVFIFSVRTRRPFFKASRPSGLMISLAILASLATVLIPLTTSGVRVFGFVRPASAHLMLIFALVCVYFLVTESVKLAYYRFAGRS